MMFGANSRDAMRLINSLREAHQQAQAAAAAPIKQPRQRRRAPSPESVSSSESEYSSGSSATSASSDYEDTDTIYRKVVEEEKCQYVSPTGLKQNSKSRKQAADYLKSKNCPVVEKVKKGKAAAPAPAPPTAKVNFVAPRVEHTTDGEQILHTGIIKKARKPRTVAKPEAAAPPKMETAAAAPVAAPAPAPAPAPAKAKRAPSAYNKFIGEQRKAGKSMAEAAAAWKAQKS
jgi:hypothetical protein